MCRKISWTIVLPASEVRTTDVKPPEPPVTVNVGTVVPLPRAAAWIRTMSLTATAGIGIVKVVAPAFEPVPEPRNVIAGSIT